MYTVGDEVTDTSGMECSGRWKGLTYSVGEGFWTMGVMRDQSIRRARTRYCEFTRT